MKRFLILAVLLVLPIFSFAESLPAPRLRGQEAGRPTTLGGFDLSTCGTIGSIIKSGDCVFELQKVLLERGFQPGSIDGKFGLKTKQALIRFQKSYGLAPDGRAGKATLAKIKINLPPISWRPITATRLSGLPSVTEKALVSGDLPCTHPMPEEYLRREGGMCPVAYVLLTELGTVIDSKESLKNYFSPVTSEMEAMSFVAVTEYDLLQSKEILKGQTSTANSSFLVKVARKNTFGCGHHEQSELVFRVDRSGDITLVSSKNIAGTGNEFEVCVD